MSARLFEILDAIEAGFLATNPGITFRRGAREVPKMDRPPRIVWVPTKDAFGRPVKGGFNPRPLYSRRAGLEAHLWGLDLEMTENLLHGLVRVLHSLTHGSVEVADAIWGQPEWLQQGWACVLSLGFDLPVTNEIVPTATISSIVPDPAVHSPATGLQPSVLQCGDPG